MLAIQVWNEGDVTSPDWRVWHRYSEDVRLPGPGCYAVQIDGLGFAELMIVNAVFGPQPESGDPRPKG